MNFTLGEADKKILVSNQRKVSTRTEYIKITVLLMLDSGFKLCEITEILGINDSTIRRYRTKFESDGLDTYLKTNYHGYWGFLSSIQISELRKELNLNLYTDSKAIAEYVKTRFAFNYAPKSIVNLLKRIGFVYKKTKQVPCETNIAAQEQFLEEFKTLLVEVANNKATIYFADGVHPTHNTRSTHAWIEKGTEREQFTVSGRDRVNINAVMNAMDPTDVIVVECKSVNSESTKELYQKVLLRKSEFEKIYIISDQAKYYHNKRLSEWVETVKITRKFLPTYSPNLNLIERLWKFMRKKIINTCFYRKKEDFRQAVVNFLEHLEDYKDELTSLMTLNFHIRKPANQF